MKWEKNKIPNYLLEFHFVGVILDTQRVPLVHHYFRYKLSNSLVEVPESSSILLSSTNKSLIITWSPETRPLAGVHAGNQEIPSPGTHPKESCPHLLTEQTLG